jgi:hypothetical protein
VQAAPPPPIDEYLSNSTVGSDEEALATSRRAPSKVIAPRRTRQTILPGHDHDRRNPETEAKKKK